MKDKKNIDIRNFFCWNEECEYYNKTDEENIEPSYYTGKDKDILILKCIICGKNFQKTKGQFFIRKKLKKTR